MKYLKLDARHPECHGLARALVGNNVYSISKYNFWVGQFIGITPSAPYSFVCEDSISQDPDADTTYSNRVITIFHIDDTLKLCPYVAMREGVRVKGVLRECEWDGTLDECNHGFFTFDTHFEISEITLDLDNLPKGAEIVEDVK